MKKKEIIGLPGTFFRIIDNERVKIYRTIGMSSEYAKAIAESGIEFSSPFGLDTRLIIGNPIRTKKFLVDHLSKLLKQDVLSKYIERKNNSLSALYKFLDSTELRVEMANVVEYPKKVYLILHEYSSDHDLLHYLKQCSESDYRDYSSPSFGKLIEISNRLHISLMTEKIRCDQDILFPYISKAKIEKACEGIFKSKIPTVV